MIPEQRTGVLNYIISRIVVGSIIEKEKSLTYQDINDIVGIFECAKMEFYERIVKKFEHVKRELNGDIKEYIS